MDKYDLYLIDKYGKRYNKYFRLEDDDTVVFSEEPPLEFDIKAHGLSLRLGGSYNLHYRIKDGKLYMAGVYGQFKRRSLIFRNRLPMLFGAFPKCDVPNKAYRGYSFEYEMKDYSGTLSIGKDFIMSYYPKTQMDIAPFCPEVYRKNGFIKIENGTVVEFVLEDRKKKDNKKREKEDI